MAASLGKVDKKFGVVALEIGFPLNGHGFSFQRDPWTLRWHEMCQTFVPSYRSRERIPMSALFTKDKLLHSLGYAAEDNFLELKEDDVHRDLFFYKNMDIQQVRTTMTDVNGKTMSSTTVIVSVIRHQYDQLGKRMIKVGMTIDEMAFVIVIPGNMTYGTKSLIFEAALEAGIGRNDLSLVSRPMANLAYCQHLLEEESKMKQTTHMIIIDLQESTAEVHGFEKKEGEHFTTVAQYTRDTRNVSFRHTSTQFNLI